jgi:hypothetical protein
MSARPIDTCIAQLDAAAHAASVAEESYRSEAAERVKGLERARAFAFRRLNLVREVARAMTGAKDEAEALQSGAAAFLREVNWTGGSESQREVIERFKPILAALWRMSGEEAPTGDAPDIGKDLADFETWFAANRAGSFLSLMDGEVLELPLVEV